MYRWYVQRGGRDLPKTTGVCVCMCVCVLMCTLCVCVCVCVCDYVVSFKAALEAATACPQTLATGA